MVVATGKPRDASLVRVVRLYPGGLRLEEVERPVPREDEVLVRVHATPITRGELEWAAGRLPAVPSYELSGVVVGTGEEVFALTPSDRDGVAADYARVPLAVLAPKPGRLTHIEAAALPMGGLSAWQALFVHGHLQPAERVLVTGSSGGVGHLAVQLARFCRRRGG
jgi:NADPH:quinone reductase-like Zn-dependent oxidoreductase